MLNCTQLYIENKKKEKKTSFSIELEFYVTIGGESHGRRVAAATYLKNFTRRRMDEVPSSPELHREFRNQLAQALLQTEPAILKVLVEAVCICFLSWSCVAE